MPAPFRIKLQARPEDLGSPVPERPGAETPANPGDEFEPAYLGLHQTGELKTRSEILWGMMAECRLCPRECGVNRLRGERGICSAPGPRLVVSSYGAHFGEERPLVGAGGSGTIFFSHCSLRCVFCQNWEISIAGQGIEQTVEDLADMMLDLQDSGCHNINVVTPTHFSAHILKALDHAAARGLRLPLVYNTSGWERLEILALLDGIVDIYMPDFKYCTANMAAQYSSGAENYPELAAKAILEMHRQVGAARYTEGGIMQRGLIIRHLVLPNNVSGSEKIMEWIALHLPKDTFVNIMAQYHPDYKAYDIPELSRKVTAREYKAVVERAKQLGLVNLDIQGPWLL